MVKKATIGATLASLALAHPQQEHQKRDTIPADGKIWTSCKDKSTIALTFDDGPYQYTQHIVDQLTAAGHRATFFQNGKLSSSKSELKRLTNLRPKLGFHL